ncbi:hypothetical protein [Desulfosarcina cetonica]|uniref:hypothetical protein n=1 Tax=Desulfosarcina cetonica TaxID=90730 RepID=UPI0006D1E44F|nr:hypothetical protein [Desulfosarcina cetonica]
MMGSNTKDNRFGAIAVEMNIIDPAGIERALVVQARILEKAKVSMPIGEILVEMSIITAAQRDEILQMQQEIDGVSDECPGAIRCQPVPLPERAPKSNPLRSRLWLPRTN